MPNVYVEARPKGRPQESAMTILPRARDHQNTTGGNRVGEKEQFLPLVARVRHLNDKEKPDHWRSA